MKQKLCLKILLAAVVLALYRERALAVSESEIVRIVNERRAGSELGALRQDAVLAKGAAAKLADMQQYKYWSHTNPVTKEYWWRLAYKAGARGKLGENLARGYSSEVVVVDAWESSAAHRANMMNKLFRKMGVAIGEVSYPEGIKTVVVALFES